MPLPPPARMHPVVITGIGAVTPMGNDWPSSWAALCAGRSGVGLIESFDSGFLPVHIAAEVRGFDAAAILGVKQARRAARSSQLAMVAAREAVTAARLDVTGEADEIGVLIASGVGGFEVVERSVLALERGGLRRISPLGAAMNAVDMAAGLVAMDLGVRGPNMAVASACASGAHALGEAASWIARGDATSVITGGTEAALTPTGVAMFAVTGALSVRNDEPELASRPFDRDRDGFVAAEGAVVMVLEDEAHARERGAPILARLTGYGASADAHHITQPDPLGLGARLCIERALARAHLAAADIDYLNAHGTSTRLNDATEAAILRAVLGEAIRDIRVSSTKSMTGHLLGAAGALEAAVVIGAIGDGFVPPTINLDNVDPGCELNHVAHRGIAMPVSVGATTSFGFGGHNACLILEDASRPAGGTPPR